MTELKHPRILLYEKAATGEIDPQKLIKHLLSRIDSFDLEGMIRRYFPEIQHEMYQASLDEDW